MLREASAYSELEMTHRAAIQVVPDTDLMANAKSPARLSSGLGSRFSTILGVFLRYSATAETRTSPYLITI
jgi:hypothetical protein